MTRNQRGFSLVELLVVTVIMGLVITSIYTLYLGTQKTAITSEEVVEVQQNLRFALDQIASDIRLAGFLVPNGTDPFTETPESINGNDLVMNTSMITRRYARIDTVLNTAPPEFIVASREMVDLFDVGDRIFVIRPHTYEVLWDGRIINGKDRDERKLVARPFDDDDSEPAELLPIEFFPGDVLVPANTVAVSYRLIADPNGGANVFLLEREVDGTSAVVAGKITDLTLRYLLIDGTEETDFTIADRSDIVAVRVRIEGQTDETMTGQDNFSGIKTRALETVVRLRNR